jgi:hypothetical protein
MTQFDPDQLLDRKEMAAMLSTFGYKISAQTLSWIACTRGDGCEYSIFNGRALYRAGAAKAWAEKRASKPRKSSSECVAA